MGRIDDNRAHRDVGDIFDEDDTALLKTSHDVLVVHDGVPDVDRRTVDFQGKIHDLDRVGDAGAKPARRGEDDLFHGPSLPGGRIVHLLRGTTVLASNDERPLWPWVVFYGIMMALIFSAP